MLTVLATHVRVRVFPVGMEGASTYRIVSARSVTTLWYEGGATKLANDLVEGTSQKYPLPLE